MTFFIGTAFGALMGLLIVQLFLIGQPILAGVAIVAWLLYFAAIYAVTNS